MKEYSFGKIIKDLRRGKGITQSRLAELLSVSPQAVSKWENNVGYPDLTLLAPLSDVLGVSTDYLLGKNADTKSEEICAARNRTNELWQNEDDKSDECIEIWRELCRKYPSDYECRNELAFQLLCVDKDSSDLEQKYREAASLLESVLDESTDSDARDTALYHLVNLYGNKLGEIELAIEYAKKGGRITGNTAHLMTQIDGNPERNHRLQYEVWYMTCGLAWAIADQNHASVDEKIFAIRAALRIIDTVCYDMPRAYFDSYFSAGFLRLLVQLRAENRLFDDTIYADIEAMIESARRADEEPLGRHFFKGNVFMDSVYYEHTISDCQTKFAKEALDEACFDPIRDSERFRELYKMTVGNFDLS